MQEIAKAENLSLIPIGTAIVSDIVTTVKDLPVIKEEDANFLVCHAEHLGKVMENTYMWRTDIQKRSIINDLQHPTLHSKFHQCILEQKVQFDQAMYLAKDFEMKKLEVEELECDLDDLAADDINHPENARRNDIKRRKIMLNLSFKQYELKQMQIAMDYRMKEVKGWQVLEEDLLEQMRASGLSEEAIWTKDAGETKKMFFLTMNNLQGITKTTDSGEYNNLVSLAAFSYKMAKQAGLLDEFIAEASPVQRDSIAFIENYLKNK